MPTMLNDRPVPGFDLGPGPGLDADRSKRIRAVLDVLIDDVRRFSESLTPRETTILKLGLAASHLEESLVQGDWARAEAHARNVVKLLRVLGG